MATYYWVGGTGTWSGAGNTQFAASSGGVPTILNPTSADTVNFDANSGTAATVTVTDTATCLTSTINKSDITLSLSGSPTFAGTMTLTTGSLVLNGFTWTTARVSSNNTNTRSVSFGGGKFVANSGGTAGNTVWDFRDLTNLTLTGSFAADFTYAGAAGSRIVYHGSVAGGTETNSLNATYIGGGDSISEGGGIRYKNLVFSGFTGIYLLGGAARTIYGNLTFVSGMTLSAGANTTTFAATSGTQQITTAALTIDTLFTQNAPGATVQLQDNLTLASTRTYTLTAGTLDLKNLTLTAGLFSSSNSNARAITFGTGNITITGNAATVWAAGNVTNFSYTGTPTINCIYSGSTGTRTLNASTTSGSEANALTFNISAGSDIVTFGSNNNVKNVNFTGFSGTFSNTALSVYGNYTISSGMTVTAGANAVTFAATSGTQQITTNGKTLDMPLTFNGIGGTFTFQDALTQGSTRAFTVTNGTVQLKASATSTVGSFVTSGANQKFLQSTTSGTQATLSQASGVVNTSYLTIQDIFATGGATWNSFYSNGNLDNGNNTNWIFGETPAYGAEYEYKLRSFTEPRRF
jgi:hypothetical protein